jgi:hypothetical protein
MTRREPASSSLRRRAAQAADARKQSPTIQWRQIPRLLLTQNSTLPALEKGKPKQSIPGGAEDTGAQVVSNDQVHRYVYLNLNIGMSSVMIMNPEFCTRVDSDPSSHPKPCRGFRPVRVSSYSQVPMCEYVRRQSWDTIVVQHT